MLRHVVVWSMLNDRSGDLDRLIDAIERLPDQIDEIEALSCGRLLNESENDAILTVDVCDQAALERYRSHPAHQPVLEDLRDMADEIVVADYQF